MEIKVKTNIGNVEYEFSINENSEMEGLHKAIVLGNPKLYCDECKNPQPQSFRMDSNKDKEGNIYVNVVCRKCGAKSKLGQYKSKGYFWHKFEKWVGKGVDEENSIKSTTEKTATVSNNDDLPF